MEYVRSYLKFENKLVVEFKGSAGGLCILWKNGMSIKEVEFDKNLIAVKIVDSTFNWLVVCFYGPPYHSKKKKAWGSLFALLEAHHGPWACIGDFNFIINDEEKSGSKKGGALATNFLKELLFEFNAVDLGYSRDKFTWAKGKWGSAVIKRRMDRGITGISWRLAYPKASITHLNSIKSDHTPFSSTLIQQIVSLTDHSGLKQLGLEMRTAFQ